jgi:hypothetical protein
VPIDENELQLAADGERTVLTAKTLSASQPQELPDPSADSLPGRVRSALFAVPENFQGVIAPALQAPDIHTLGAVLGSTIEQEVVETLNRLRNTTWDPDGELAGYRFVRQAQVFPDVVLKATDPEMTPHILLGIELKGWYVLAKERMPNFRFKATPESCAVSDMLVVFPWALSRVISGEAQVFPPWIVNARYAAEYRNWHWVHAMGSEDSGSGTSRADRSILLSAVTEHYPESGTEEHNDEARNDKGGNFGRTARTGLMSPYLDQVFDEEALAGIPLRYWQRFLELFGKELPTERIIRSIDRMASELRGHRTKAPKSQLEDLRGRVIDLAQAIELMSPE